MSERQAALRNERMDLLAAMMQDLRARNTALQERYDALMEGLGLDPSPECMDEYPTGRLKAEGYGLRMSVDSLGEALADAAAELVLKDAEQERDRYEHGAEGLKEAISHILGRALAGYTDDYKLVTQGHTYIQWGKVESDMHAAIDAALATTSP